MLPSSHRNAPVADLLQHLVDAALRLALVMRLEHGQQQLVALLRVPVEALPGSAYDVDVKLKVHMYGLVLLQQAADVASWVGCAGNVADTPNTHDLDGMLPAVAAARPCEPTPWPATHLHTCYMIHAA